MWQEGLRLWGQQDDELRRRNDVNNDKTMMAVERAGNKDDPEAWGIVKEAHDKYFQKRTARLLRNPEKCGLVRNNGGAGRRNGQPYAKEGS